MMCQFLLYNKVNQLYIYIYHRMSSLLLLPPSLSHLSRWSQSTELIFLCPAAASHQLSILHLVVYISPCHSLTLSQLTLPPPCVLKSILYICVISYYKILAIFPILYCIYLQLIYFIHRSLYVLIPTLFCPVHFPHPTGNHQFVLCICESVFFVLYSLLCCIFQIQHIRDIIQYLSFSV